MSRSNPIPGRCYGLVRFRGLMTGERNQLFKQRQWESGSNQLVSYGGVGSS